MGDVQPLTDFLAPVLDHGSTLCHLTINLDLHDAVVVAGREKDALGMDALLDLDKILSESLLQKVDVYLLVWKPFGPNWMPKFFADVKTYMPLTLRKGIMLIRPYYITDGTLGRPM